MNNHFCVAETLSSAGLDLSDAVLVRFFGLAERFRLARIRDSAGTVRLECLSVALALVQTQGLQPEDGAGDAIRCTVALQGRSPLPFPRLFTIFHRVSLRLDVPRHAEHLQMRACNDHMVSRFTDFCDLHAEALQVPSMRQTDLGFELLHA